MAAMQLAGSIVSLAGSLFLFLGALGVLRMPDIYNRMQAGTKATTLGSIMTLVGIGIYRPEWLPQTLILAGFVLMTNPLSSHALARAAHAARIPLAAGTVVDRLREDEDAAGVAGHKAAENAPAAGAGLNDGEAP
ncbi:MAG: Na+/H+ antiporter subunit G [Candidatus Krumholzibacteriota bacterium]|nr:Na+/H+ antiporter subunit G [Candidatus Krumholzibacteriota bacterium]